MTRFKKFTDMDRIEAAVSDYTKVVNDVANATVYIRNEGDNRLTLYCFYAKRRTASRIISAIEANSEKYISDFFKNCEKHTQAIKEARDERFNQPRGLEVGDILSQSWGHEQTNVNFYQVVEIKGKSSVVVQEISGKIRQDTNGNGMSGYCVAVPNKFIGKQIKKIAKNGSVSLDGYCANKWGNIENPGKELYCSWYA